MKSSMLLLQVRRFSILESILETFIDIYKIVKFIINRRYFFSNIIDCKENRI